METPRRSRLRREEIGARSRVVVTGGSGFIGRLLVERLLDRRHEVRIFDRQPADSAKANVIRGDVRNAAALEDALRGADAVYHLAAEHEDDVQPPSLYFDVNVEGTRNLVQAAERTGVHRIVFTSTAAIYPPSPRERDEETAPAPINDYGRSKLEAERLLLDWCGADRSLVIVRPTAVFGKGSKGNVQNLIDSMASNRFLMVGGGDNRKSLAYVTNLVDFLVRALRLEESPAIVNYADKPDLTMTELVGLIREELGRNGWTPRVPYWMGLMGGHLFDAIAAATGRKPSISSQRVRKFCADTRLATKKLETLGFEPAIDIRQALRRTVRDTVLDAPGREPVGVETSTG